MVWLVLLLIFNFGISWWNAFAAGMIWDDTKRQGGFARLVAWSAAVQSACGFTMVLAAVIALLGAGAGLLPQAVATGVMQLTYVLIIVPLLGSGLVITIHSWKEAIRSKSIVDTATAAYNTYAMADNLYHSVDLLGECLSGLGKLASSSDDDNPFAGLALAVVIGIVLFSSLGGVLLTRSILLSSARTARQIAYS